MRILMVIPGLSRKLGGTTTLSIGFYKYLKQLAQVEMLTMHTSEEELEAADEAMLQDTDVRSFRSSWNEYKYAPAFLKAVREKVEEVDLVHIHGLWHGAAFPTARIAAKAGVPFVISPHGMFEPDAFQRSGWKKQLFWKLLFKPVFRKAAAVHCTAQSEIANTKRFDPGAHTIYVPNGVELPELSEKTPKSYLLFMGRLHPKKAVDRLLQAIKLLEDTYPEERLQIAGTGDTSYVAKLKQLCSELDLEDRVSFVGFAGGEQKAALFRGAKFALIPSFSEGLPLSALESLSYGLPLVITKASNVPEVTSHQCGIELEDNEPTTIAAGIDTLFQTDLTQMARNARDLAEIKFEWGAIARQLHEEYETILNRVS